MGTASLRRVAVLAALSASMLAAACGGGGDEEGEARPAAPPPAATSTTVQDPQFADVRITKPRDRAALRAELDEDGSLVTKAVVSGKAESYTDLLLTGGCDRKGCAVTTTTDEYGRFEAKVVVAATLDRPATAVTVEYGFSVPVRSSDRIRLRLRAPDDDGGRRGGGGRDPDDPRPDPIEAGDVEVDDGLGGLGDGGSSSGPTTSSTGSGRSGAFVMVGDSLAQGTEPYLPGLLSGWRVTQNASRGRRLAEGMSIFQGLPAAGSQTVYAFSLFTNDDPRNTTALASAVRASAQRAATAGGCAIWATIARPPYGGVSYAGPNAVLRRLDSQLERVVLVDWAGAVAANPSWMSGDGVHGTPTGYRARAQMYADAARSCL